MVIYQKLLPRTKKRGVSYLSLKISSLNRLASYDEYPPVSPMMLAMCVSKGERRSAVLCPSPVAQMSWLCAVFCLSRCSQCHHYWLLVCIKEQTAGNVCNSVILTISQMNILIGTSSGNAPMRVLMDADVSEDHPLVVKRPNQPNV